jgi:hypothetical protein
MATALVITISNSPSNKDKTSMKEKELVELENLMALLKVLHLWGKGLNLLMLLFQIK